jgi:MFS family permease
MRQSLELFLTPVTRDLALTAADFTLAVAIQNIVWGVSQAPIGAIADRFGLRAFCKGLHPDVEQHLQRPAFRGRLARQVAADRC